MADSLRIADAFPAVEGKRYHRHLAELRGFKASGVYAIADAAGNVLYVGESHSDRLYDTITRHFRRWSIDSRRDAQSRRRGGTTYNRREVRVIYLLCPRELAEDLQYREIRRLLPRDNLNDANSTRPDLPV